MLTSQLFQPLLAPQTLRTLARDPKGHINVRILHTIVSGTSEV